MCSSSRLGLIEGNAMSAKHVITGPSGAEHRSDTVAGASNFTNGTSAA
jgi:hypothetical protein